MISLVFGIELFILGIFFIYLYFTKSDAILINRLRALFSYAGGLPASKKRIFLYAIISFFISFSMVISHFYSDTEPRLGISKFPSLSAENWIFFVIGNVIVIIILYIISSKYPRRMGGRGQN